MSASQQRLSAPVERRAAPRTELPDVVAFLWQALTEMFGPAFLTAYGDEDGGPPKLWIGGLSQFTMRQVKAGLATIANQSRQYPPNLTEVREACIGRAPGVRFGGVPVKSDYLLDVPRASRSHVDAMLANMRRRVASSTIPDVAETEPAPVVHGCTCKGEGSCDICIAYTAAASGAHVEFPRGREPGEEG